MPAILQISRTAVDNRPPVDGSLLPGQLAIEMGAPTRLWVGVPPAISANMQKLLYDSSSPSGGGSSVTIGDTAPATPNPGDLWWDSVSGNLFVWYSDVNSSQWVIANTGGGGGSSITDPVGQGTWGRLETGTWLRSVALGGDVMTGDLTAPKFHGIMDNGVYA